MNVCICSPAFPLDEQDYRAAFSLDFCRALERRGHRVIVHTPDRIGQKADLGLDIRWFAWTGGTKAIARTRFWHPRDVRDFVSLLRNGERSLSHLVRSERIEICLALWALPSGWFARRILREQGIPYAVWALGSDVWTYGRLPVFSTVVRKVFQDATRCLADGRDLAARVEALSGRECRFMPTSRALPAARLARSSPDNLTRFLFVGRYDHVKGADLIPEAARLLSEETQDFHIRVFGEGPQEEALRRQVADLGMERFITVGGKVSRQEFSDELAQADALLIPSRMESIPVVMTDALQKGVPVLVSDVGDMGDLIRTYGAGLVFRPDDAEALADTLRRFCQGGGNTRFDTETLSREMSLDRAVDIFLEESRPTAGRESLAPVVESQAGHRPA